MLEYLIYIEERGAEDIKIEAFKAAVLNAFPSKELYKELYSTTKDEEVVDVPLEEYTDIQDVMDILNGTFRGSEDEIVSG